MRPAPVLAKVKLKAAAVLAKNAIGPGHQKGTMFVWPQRVSS